MQQFSPGQFPDRMACKSVKQACCSSLLCRVCQIADTSQERVLFLVIAFAEIGITDWKPYVKQNPAFMRPAEVDLLLGNPEKAERELGWERKVDFPGLVKLMVTHDLTVEETKI